MRPVTNDARFSVGVALGAWVAAYVAALPLQALVIAAFGRGGDDPDTWPTSVTAVSILCLWIPFVVGLVIVSRRFGGASFVRDYRVGFRPVDLLGVPLGLAAQFVVLPLLYWPLSTWFPGAFDSDDVERRATELWDRAFGIWILVLVLIVAVGAPLVEEFVYRGLILQSLEGRFNDVVALVVSAAWFAAIHLQPVELPGLFVVGLVFGLCWQRSGRIAMSVLAHVAFNAAGLFLASR